MIPTRRHWLLKALAFLVLWNLAPVVIYLNDPWNISMALAGFAAYIFVIAVNFLQQNLFSDLFFAVSHAPDPIYDAGGSLTNWSPETLLFSTAIYTLSQAARLLFWVGAWFFLRRYRQQIAEYEDYIHTGNDFLDIIIRDKARQAKEDKFLHGFGIGNIQKAVEKYAGQCLIRQGKDCFQLKILLPLP